ncbi:MAG: PIG-L deacetylase family protein [Opitutales bacterium]
MMHFSQPAADLYVPDERPLEEALPRTTRMGIGAHQDDLEFMALHGILECFHKTDQWFGGITCTDGAGSSRSGPYAEFSDEQMKAVRLEEQKAAAQIGQYGFMAQLGHSSAHAKEPAKRNALSSDIRILLEHTLPEVVYTHNPFDKHRTHVGVLLAVLEAVHALPESDRPRQIFGCEVWRGLDWLPDSLKVIHNVSAHPNLAASLNGVFDSQITGGKRYDLAVEGRRLANATFFESHAVDDANRVAYAIDLSALRTPEVSLEDFMRNLLDTFDDEVLGLINDLKWF